MPMLLFLSVLVSSAQADETAASYTPDGRMAKALTKAAAAGADVVVDLPVDPETMKAGESIYATRCAVCHGPSGQGDGPAAISLQPAPADFADADRWGASTMGAKLWIIDKGIAGTGMAPTGLEATAAQQVLAYIQETFGQQ